MVITICSVLLADRDFLPLERLCADAWTEPTLAVQQSGRGLPDDFAISGGDESLRTTAMWASAITG
jgi:hypothetical protein